MLIWAGWVLAIVSAFLARVLLGDFTFTLPDAVRIVLGEAKPAGLARHHRRRHGRQRGRHVRDHRARPTRTGSRNLGCQWRRADGCGRAPRRWLRRPAGPHRRRSDGRPAGPRQYLFTRADEYDAHIALRWLTGSVSEATWSQIWLVAVGLLVLLPLTALLVKSLAIAELGPDLATGLGVRPRRTDLVLLMAVLLVALAVAVAGPVSFVAFLSGPIARALNGGRRTLLGACLVGALIVVAAEYPADYLFADVTVPVGVVTGALGAPVLLWLLATDRARSSAR
jgi:hypothetical protein